MKKFFILLSTVLLMAGSAYAADSVQVKAEDLSPEEAARLERDRQLEASIEELKARPKKSNQVSPVDERGVDALPAEPVLTK